MCNKNIGKNGSFLTDIRSKSGKQMNKSPDARDSVHRGFVFMKQD